MITLDRYKSTPDLTLGRLSMPCGYTCYVLELPWRGNRRSKSCIPDGEYPLRKRRSPVVQRSSGGEFREGYELTCVPDRTYIMIHPGNWVRNTDGCLLPGRKPQDIRGELGVPSSRAVFRELMARLDKLDDDERLMRVRWSLDEFPRDA